MAGDNAMPKTPVTPPLDTHGTHLNHNPDAGVPRRPTQGRLPNVIAASDEFNNAVVPADQIFTAPQWTGPPAISGDLAHPDDPFVTSPGSANSTLTASAPVFVPSNKRDRDGDSGPSNAGSSGGNSFNAGSKTGNSGNGKSKAVGDDKSTGTSDRRDSSNTDNDISSGPVIANGAVNTQLSSKSKGKQPMRGFSTKTCPTRFMVVENVTLTDFDPGNPMAHLKASPHFQESVNKLGIFEFKPASRGSAFYTAIIFCDSLAASQEIFSKLQRTFAVSFISQDAFLELKVEIPEHVRRLSAGINMTSTLKKYGLSTNDVTDMTKTVAAKFGKIVHFTMVGRGINSFTYRIEFDCVNDALDALLNTTPDVDVSLGRHQYLSITTSELDPSLHFGSPVSQSSRSSGLGSPNGDQMEYSGTGRTATRLGPNGKKSTMQGYKQPGPAQRPEHGFRKPQHGFDFGNQMPQGNFPSTPGFNAHPAGIYQPADPFTGRAIMTADGHLGHAPQDVNDLRVEEGQDIRTTLMIRNVPPEWTAELLEQTLVAVVPGEFDFAYNRIDFRQNQSVGYAFVNFTSTTALLKYVRRWRGQLLPRNIFRRHQKPCAVSYANVQGYECLVAKFRNSSILDEAKGCRPRLFWTKDTAPTPDMIGQERDWPGVDNQAKKQRSLENANIQGLYAPRARGNGRGGRRGGRGSQYDRGTPQQNQAVIPGFTNNYHYGAAPSSPHGPYYQPRTSQTMPYGPYMNQQFGLQGPAYPGSMLRTHTNGQLGNRPTTMPSLMAPVHYPEQAYAHYQGDFEPLFTPVKGQAPRHFRPAY